jgi:hypothetical protein
MRDGSASGCGYGHVPNQFRKRHNSRVHNPRGAQDHASLQGLFEHEVLISCVKQLLRALRNYFLGEIEVILSSENGLQKIHEKHKILVQR